MMYRFKIKGFLSVLLIGLISAYLISCSDDEKPKIIPEVTTAAVTDITTTTAMGGGEIVSDGNADITASGLVYSSTNTMPSIADSKTEETVTSGMFTSALESLMSGTTYHVRAYATNSVGTGYGDVVSFTTGNEAPVATNVTVTGDVEIEAVLTATYTYSDAESDAEGGTTFQWYIADDAAGTGEAAIADATTSTYTILATDEFKYIRVGVTPMAAAGTTAGTEVKSDFVGPVPEAPETVTFMYNGEEVTYGVITSSVTGRKWMDRNLGASAVAAHYQDHKGYGDLFQWGRLADGHQLITWTQDIGVGSSTPVNGTTETISTTDVPGHSLFILGTNAANVTFPDWRNPQNPTLWQAPNYINNPCPAGWHIPNNAEWDAENLSGAEIASDNHLKITTNGERRPDSGEISSVLSASPGRSGKYWSSDVFYSVSRDIYFSHYCRFSFDENGQVSTEWVSAANNAIQQGDGKSCRCIKNEE